MTADDDAPVQDDAVRVVVCEDHALLRRRLIVTLETDPLISVVAEAVDTGHLLAVARDATPDCVVIGLKVNPDGAVAATAAVRAELPHAKVVVLLSRTDEVDAVRAVLAGATGLVTREALDQAPAVVAAAASGTVAIPPLVARLLIDEAGRLGATQGPDHPLLTDRERAVLEHLSAGHSYRTAGSALQLPDHGAKNLAANAVEKLVRRSADRPG